MTDLAEIALGFVDRSNHYTTARELLTDFTGVVAAFGFKHYIMTGLPAYGEDVEKLIVANGWPPAWLDRYREGRYFYDDPVTQWAFASSKPFRWQDAREQSAATRRTEIIAGEAREFGMVDGLGFPLYDPNNWQAVVSLAADHEVTLTPREVALLHTAAAVCQGQAAHLGTEAMIVPALTAREKDILTWLAHGKTAWEVSTILQLSESTIRTHLRHITAKLDVANTTHAVAKAMHSRQIRL